MVYGWAHCFLADSGWLISGLVGGQTLKKRSFGLKMGSIWPDFGCFQAEIRGYCLPMSTQFNHLSHSLKRILQIKMRESARFFFEKTLIGGITDRTNATHTDRLEIGHAAIMHRSTVIFCKGLRWLCLKSALARNSERLQLGFSARIVRSRIRPKRSSPRSKICSREPIQRCPRRDQPRAAPS
jgi:hypothetical protein